MIRAVVGRPKILIVDDDLLNLSVLENMLNDIYDVQTAQNSQEVFIRLSFDLPDIILLDIRMPDIDGYEVCRQLKSDIATEDIPIIFVTAESSDADEVKSFELGAIDHIVKPVNRAIIRARVNTHLKTFNEIKKVDKKITERVLEFKKSYFDIENKINIASNYHEHENSELMYKYSKLIATRIGLNDANSDILSYAASMHDIGKMIIPDYILNKTDKLTNMEWEIMKKHTIYGVEILGSDNSKLMEQARLCALTHHEKWDGTGYPQGLSGTSIPLAGRITAIVDTFTALSNDRPYKDTWEIDNIVEYMKKESGKRFDPNIVDIFLDNLVDILKIRKEYFNEMKKIA